MRSDSSTWQRTNLGRYVIGLITTALALLLRKSLDSLVHDYTPYLTLYPAVVFLAMYVGLGPSIVAVILGVLGATYWFVEAHGSFNVNDPSTHIVGSVSFLVVSACVIAAGEVRRRAQASLRHIKARFDAREAANSLERKQSEEALNASASHLRRFLEAAPTGLTRCSRDLHYLSANRAYSELAGLPADQIVGRPIVDVLGNDGWKVIQPYVERVLRGERAEYETVLPFAANGSRYIHVIYTPENDDSEVVGWVASVTDITEFKRMEKQLQEMEKIAAAGRLAGTLAHEINNPLTVIVDVLHMLGTRSDLDATSTGLLSIANNEVARLSRIVKQSLSYYRTDTAPKEVHLAGLTEESLRVFSEKFHRAGIAVRKKKTPETSIVGFPDEIRQVIDNLLVNAAEATPRGGRVTLSVRPSRNWKNLNEPGARLTIADNGCGIPKAILSRVFEPFFTTKGEKGNGLGLWVVRGIVEKHGGNIKIRSTDNAPSSGTVVSIFWPKSTVTKELVRPA